MLNELAEEYVRLTLKVGKHDPDYVDSYFGPPGLKEEAERDCGEPRSLLNDARRLAAAIEESPVGEGDNALRRHFLQAHARSLAFRLGMLAGNASTFDEETQELYGVNAPTTPQSSIDSVLRELSDLLPGPGSVTDRYVPFRESLRVPPDVAAAVFSLAVEVARSRTKQHLKLPAEETFALELVTQRPWAAWNWYQGGFHSLIQLNTSLPCYVDKIVELACHEGYPGHHVFESLRERDLVNRRAWLEYSVVALYSPVTLMSEGAAMVAADLLFSDHDRVAIDTEVFYPVAGVDRELAPLALRVRRLVEKLEPVNCDVARAFLGGDISRESAAALLTRYCLLRRDQAEERLNFIQRFRSYIATYSVGPIIVGDFLARVSTERRWSAYAALIGFPVTPRLLVEKEGPAARAFVEKLAWSPLEGG